jgi:putative hydrolase of the HAD superfamily
MIKAILFDLDSCLAAADEVGQQLFAPAFAAIRAANAGRVPEEQLQAAFGECWRIAFDAVAAKYGFTDAMRAAGWEELRRTEVTTPMHGYGDLAALKELPVQKFLVTSGFRRLQESKVRALGFADWFAAILIDAIDEPNRRGKHVLFQDLLARYGLCPDEVLVVGDNPDSEIEAGNRLGMRTIQILRPGVPRTECATGHIPGLLELRDWVKAC